MMADAPSFVSSSRLSDANVRPKDCDVSSSTSQGAQLAVHDDSREKPEDPRSVIFFDIDNTLYSASSRIADAMSTRIHFYFTSLGLSEDEASETHLRYHKTYGLALRGLVSHHKVDPLDFDRRCDQSLNLEEMIKPVPSVRKLIQDIDRTRFRVWALTNAYIHHARRVLKILNLSDLFDDVIFCDYADPNFSCKPEEAYFHAALKKANVSDPSKVYFIDDSLTNVNAAMRLGWGHCVHFCEVGLETMEGGVRKRIGTPLPSNPSSTSASGAATPILNGNATHNSTDVNGSGKEDVLAVSTLEGLRDVWPEVFSSSDLQRT